MNCTITIIASTNYKKLYLDPSVINKNANEIFIIVLPRAKRNSASLQK